MNKKSILLMVAVFFFTFTMVHTAFAGNTTPELGPYMTLENSTTPKTTFGWDEKPFAFIQWDLGDLNTNKKLWMGWEWQYGSQIKDIDIDKFNLKKISTPDNLLNIWDDMKKWDNKKKVGEWSVRFFWYNDCNAVGTQKVNFTVTPEPVSSVLFLLGGLALAGAKLNRRPSQSKV